MDEVLLRNLIPGVLAILVRRGADVAADEDAVQDALVEALIDVPERELQPEVGVGSSAWPPASHRLPGLLHPFIDKTSFDE